MFYHLKEVCQLLDAPNPVTTELILEAVFSLPTYRQSHLEKKEA